MNRKAKKPTEEPKELDNSKQDGHKQIAKSFQVEKSKLKIKNKF